MQRTVQDIESFKFKRVDSDDAGGEAILCILYILYVHHRISRGSPHLQESQILKENGNEARFIFQISQTARFNHMPTRCSSLKAAFEMQPSIIAADFSD